MSDSGRPIPAGWPVPGSLAFVCPRYGVEVLGGAETVVRELAERLFAAGFPLEVLTTCAIDHHTWENFYSPGTVEVNGVTVRRFSIQHGKGRDHLSVGDRIAAGLPTSYEEQERWLNDGFRSAQLFQFLMDEHDQYHTILLTPYMFWTTYACAQVAPHKNVLRPCLHDEPAARLEIYRPIFRDARGITFNSDPEAELAERLFELPSRREVVGEGVEVTADHDPERFRKTYGVEGPFLLYAGRREWGKNVDMLVEYFARFVARTGSDLKLILVGRGEVKIPGGMEDRVIDLGFLSEQDKKGALRAATALCQPSWWESFSRILLEAWVAETPVLVYGRCPVTAHHAKASRGGLVFDDAMGFELALELLLERPQLAAEMGRNGRRYVLERYTWDRVVGRFVDCIGSWASQDVAAAR
jgi:glycosyltransferase involved in cell wall biosynthesis